MNNKYFDDLIFRNDEYKIISNMDEYILFPNDIKDKEIQQLKEQKKKKNHFY